MLYTLYNKNKKKLIQFDCINKNKNIHKYFIILIINKMY